MNATPQNTNITVTPESELDTVTEVKGPENKLRSFTVSSTEQSQQLEFVLQNDKGLPYDLSGLEEIDLSGILSESVAGFEPVPLSVVVDDASKGILKITLPGLKAGVYRGVVTLSSNNSVVIENSFLVYVSQVVGRQAGPPSLLEVRLQMRDSSPNDNYLLDGVSFSDEEIALAAMRPVQYFNEVSPPIPFYFTTNDFPWRYHWIEGMIAQLYMIAAEHFRKNNLNYSAGGLSVADMDKERNYTAAYQEKWGMFMQFVRNKKGEINMAQGWSTVPGIYSFF